MPIAKETGDERQHQEPIPAGNELAVCYSVIDLGTQWNPHFEKHARKVLIQWEVPEYRIKIERDGKELDLPRAISKQYTLSLHEKSNLRKDLEAWRGKGFTAEELAGFDVANIAGHACMLQIIHEAGRKDPSKVYAKIASVSSVPRQMQRPKPENPVQVFDIPDVGDINIPEPIPDWIKDIIKQSEEWKERKQADEAIADAGQSGTPAPSGSAFSDDAVGGDDLPF